MPISDEQLDQIALSRKEYELILDKLGREPTRVELGMFGALWSEHCGYKHSKPLLRLFPTSSAAVRIPAGIENAGMVSIGEGKNLVFKIESHNHPSAVEPYQGAATGVGGIVRDILAMGARPIALLNSLRFGPLTEPLQRYLFDNVVSGIAGYGNCIGVPDIGGEIVFDSVYSANPLVNAMCLGLLEDNNLVRAKAETPGSVLLLVGAATGRDGIHGASGLASRTLEHDRELRPTVQVGDPFLEKILIEACLEVAASDCLEGMQDLGAAGLTSSVIECVARGGTGVELNLAFAPRREPDMDAYDVMLSESQERMLLIVRKGMEEKVRKILEKWDIDSAPIGHVTNDGMARIFDGPALVAEVAVNILVDSPQYSFDVVRPEYLKKLHSLPFPPTPDPTQANSLLLKLLSCPNIASKRAVYRQYDHEVQTNTIFKPGQADAGLLRIRGSAKGIAVTVDGNGRNTYLEPYVGGAQAVAEACRNLVCIGATPIAITDCLNFGNPERSEIYYQLKECIEGMAAACRSLNVPVISGNVSLYNEGQQQSIYPTPVVGAVGLLEDIDLRVNPGFVSEEDHVYLLGGCVDLPDTVLAGSEYLSHIYGMVMGRPNIDLDLESRLQESVLKLINKGIIRSAHDCSDGGLALALAECSILGGLGFRGVAKIGERWDACLFGESPSRIIVTTTAERSQDLEENTKAAQIPSTYLGKVAKTNFILPGFIDLEISTLINSFESGLITP